MNSNRNFKVVKTRNSRLKKERGLLNTYFVSGQGVERKQEMRMFFSLKISRSIGICSIGERCPDCGSKETLLRRHRSFSLLVAFLFLINFCQVNAGELTVMFYNSCNYYVQGDENGKEKIESSKKALFQMIKAVSPDILVCAEIGSENGMRDLLSGLEKVECKYPFSNFSSGEDSSRHIVFLSKIEPVFFESRNNFTYQIRPKDKPRSHLETVGIQRGFPHAVFKTSDGYTLHVIAAHLKSRLFHKRYNQTDMRRYEARLLKYYVNGIQSANPKANILVVGDMNDTFNSDPMITLRSSEKTPDKRLYDLRPLDADGNAWTHWWNTEDSYGRIDYAYANLNLLPEIDLTKTKIPHIPELWFIASDHRPVFVSIKTNDAPLPNDKLIENAFKDSIRIEK
ncbi:MAG: hypothetical protein QXH80_01680 [Candidatus Nanoarchaeia archaeon]